MRSAIIAATVLRIQIGLIVAFFGVGTVTVIAYRASPFRHDLQGTWSNGTITPLERPARLSQLAFLSAAAAEEFERSWLENFRKNFTEEDLMAPDLD